MQQREKKKEMEAIFEMDKQEKLVQAAERAMKIIPVLGKALYPPLHQSEHNSSITILLSEKNVDPKFKVDRVAVQWRPLVSADAPWNNLYTSAAKQRLFTVEGLWPFQMYHFRTRVHNKNGWGGWSDPSAPMRTTVTPWACSTNPKIRATFKTAGGSCSGLLGVIASPEGTESTTRITAAKVADGESVMGSLVISVKKVTGKSEQCDLELAAQSAQYFGEALRDQAEHLKACPEVDPPSFEVVKAAKPAAQMIEKQQTQMMRSMRASHSRLKSVVQQLAAGKQQLESKRINETAQIQGSLNTAFQRFAKALDILGDLHTGMQQEESQLLQQRELEWQCNSDPAQIAKYKSQHYQCSSMVQYTARAVRIVSEKCRQEFQQWSTQQAAQSILEVAAGLTKCATLDKRVRFTQDTESEMYQTEVKLKQDMTNLFKGDNPLSVALETVAQDGMSASMVSKCLS